MRKLKSKIKMWLLDNLFSDEVIEIIEYHIAKQEALQDAIDSMELLLEETTDKFFENFSTIELFEGDEK